LDYRPLNADEPLITKILERPECTWIGKDLGPDHFKEVHERRLAWIEKTRAAVHDRLTKEITYWDHRAEELKLEEQAGKICKAASSVDLLS
jgi:hypothetical protein